jgi:hypothetical protein
LATIPELLDGHVTLEVECLDRLYSERVYRQTGERLGLVVLRAERRHRQQIPSPARVRDWIVFIGVAQEKAQAFYGRKIDGHFQFDRDRTVYVNHSYFYIDDEDFGPLFLKVCHYAPWSVKLCRNGREGLNHRSANTAFHMKRWKRFSILPLAGQATADLRFTGSEGH